MGIYVKTMPTSSGVGTIMGAIASYGVGYFGITTYNSTWDPYWGTAHIKTGNFILNTWYELELNYMNNKVFKENGVSLLNLGSTTITTNKMCIFRLNDDYPQPYKGKISEIKLSLNSSIVNHFIPVKRNSDNAIGLYDVINNVFYINSGTGEFLAGSEIPKYLLGKIPNPDLKELPPEYTRLNYI
jgi:hypothetical protein